MSNEEGYYWDSIKEQWSHVDEPEDDEETELSDDELEALYQFDVEWTEVHKRWLENGQKCACGQPISLDDAYYIGCCLNCMVSI